MRYLLVLILLVGTILGFLAINNRNTEQVYVVDPILVFEPENLPAIHSDFWSGEGPYGFVYTSSNKPIAYYSYPGLFIAYDASSSSSSDSQSKPTVYVYDFRAGKEEMTVKQVFPYMERVDDWETLKNFFNTGSGTPMPDYLPEFPTQEIMHQIRDMLKKNNK